jgi:hypothetical protein
MFERMLVPLDSSENAEMLFSCWTNWASNFASAVIVAAASKAAILHIDCLYPTSLKHTRCRCPDRSGRYGVGRLQGTICPVPGFSQRE